LKDDFSPSDDKLEPSCEEISLFLFPLSALVEGDSIKARAGVSKKGISPPDIPPDSERFPPEGYVLSLYSYSLFLLSELSAKAPLVRQGLHRDFLLSFWLS